MGLLAILLGLALMMWLAYKGWSVLLAAPAAALLAAAISSEPLMAHWTQTFMGGASGFVMRWLPMFLLGGLFGKLMEDSRSIGSIARSLTQKLGTRRTLFAVVLASAVVTYGGVSVFVAFFVLVPMAQDMFKNADLPRRLMPATIGLGAFTFTMSAMPGTPSVNNAIPMPYFGTTAFAAPGLGIIASVIIMTIGMWWLRRAEAIARAKGEGFLSLRAEPAAAVANSDIASDQTARIRATAVGDFDPAELEHSKLADSEPSFLVALLPLIVVIVVNFMMSLVILPQMDFEFLKEEFWGSTSLRALGGVWSVMLALTAGCLTIIIANRSRLSNLRETLDAGATAAALPLLTVSSLVGFGAVVSALPAFATVRDSVLSIGGGPLISLTVAMNALAALTGTASGGMAIALNTLGAHFMTTAAEYQINPELLHRITTISAGTLDALPHNGTVLILLKLCKLTHAESYLDMMVTVIVTCIVALIAVLILGSLFGSF